MKIVETSISISKIGVLLKVNSKFSILIFLVFVTSENNFPMKITQLLFYKLEHNTCKIKNIFELNDSYLNFTLHLIQRILLQVNLTFQLKIFQYIFKVFIMCVIIVIS